MTGWQRLYLCAASLTIQLIKSSVFGNIASEIQYTAVKKARLLVRMMQADEEGICGLSGVYIEKMSALGFEIIKPDGAFAYFAKISAGYNQILLTFLQDFAREKQLLSFWCCFWPIW